MAISAFLDIGAAPGVNPELALYSRPLTAGGQRIPASLHHLCSSGVLIECSHKFLAGDEVDIAFSGTVIEAGEIRWIGSELYGFQFHQPAAYPLIERALASTYREAAAAGGLAQIGETFGAKLQRLRLQRGMSQTDVAKNLDVTAVAISHWESDQARPRQHRLPDLARVLRVREDQLATSEIALPQTVPEVLATSRCQIAAIMGVEPDCVNISIDL